MMPEYTCAQCRECLLWYVTEQLTPAEREHIARHLATCAACQREARPWHAVDTTLDDADHAIPPDMAAASAWSTLKARLPKRPIIAETHHGERALMEHNIPNEPELDIRPRDTRHGPARRRSLVAVTVFVLLVALSVALFDVLGPQLRHNRGIGSHTTATATPAPCAPSQLKAALPANSYLQDISMVSATDGWAVGAINNPSEGTATPKTLIAHLHNCQWTPVSDAGASIASAQLTQVAMVSSTEGWAVGSTLKLFDNISQANGAITHQWMYDKLIVLHYTNGQWQQVSVPGNTSGQPQALHMTSSNDGWLLVDNGKSHTDPYTAYYAYTLLHYQSGAWSVVPMPFKTPTMILSGLVATSFDVWLDGYDGLGGIIAYYQGGQWHTWGGSIVGKLSPALYAIGMTSDSDVWAIGSNYSHDASGDHTEALVLHYEGSQWTRAVLPDLHAQQSSLMRISVLAPDDVWACGDMDASYIQANRPPQGPLALHYIGGKWQEVSGLPPAVASISQVVAAAHEQYWALGAIYVPINGGKDGATMRGVLLSYTNGAWSIASGQA